jgi:hypothetical protein
MVLGHSFEVMNFATKVKSSCTVYYARGDEIVPRRAISSPKHIDLKRVMMMVSCLLVHYFLRITTRKKLGVTFTKFREKPDLL